MKKFHPEQLSILQKLLYSNGLRYSHIKPLNMEGSKFTFHLEQLLKSELVTKLDNKYNLTNEGKELANRMDIGDEQIKSQAKISVIMVCIREIENEKEYLLYTRLKSPFYNFQGFPTGKVKKGETIAEAAKRELFEETGLSGNPKLFSIRHYRIHDKRNKLIEDKIFFACKIDNPKGNLKSNQEGKFKWVNESKVWDYLKKPVPEIKELFQDLKSNKLKFFEGEYSTRGF